MIFEGSWHSHQSDNGKLPRDEGWGWNLPKMHAFAKMPHNMLKFGSANIFSGNKGEQALKRIGKEHAEKTQRQPDIFAEQCAIHEYESYVIKYVMTDISSKLVCQLIPQNPTMKCGNLEEGIQSTFVKQMIGE
jgi:hypothetical protein